MIILRSIARVRELSDEWRAKGLSSGFVQTMGALHRGHLELVRTSLREADRSLASIFVNPLQFGPNEDFERYPREVPSDLAKLASAGCHAVFLPDDEEIFPGGARDFQLRIRVPALADTLCGQNRPGHFEGMATEVLKMLLIARCDYAYFGEKDFQQLQVIQRIVCDLNVPTQVRGVATVREADGLACSSRNLLLSAQQRALAPRLHEELCALRGRLATQGAPLASAVAEAKASLLAAGFSSVEYLSVVDPATLEELAAAQDGARIVAAARLGDVRLIDNVLLPLPAAARAARPARAEPRQPGASQASGESHA